MDWRALEGERLDGHFQLHRLIGQGGFGAVFDADQMVGDQRIRRVAVKVVTRDPERDDQMRELIAATNLHHDCLVRTFTAGQTSIQFGSRSIPLLYLVMELAGTALNRRLRRGLPGQHEWMSIALAAANGLKYLHGLSRGLVHRDVKPSNIIWCANQWKLADFGLARLLASPMDETSRIAGTLPYMSPEGLRGVVSPALDIWALGVTLAESLSGDLPFSGETDAELRRAIETEPPQLPESLAPSLRDLFSACLQKEPGSRPSAGELLDLLRPRAQAVTQKPIIVDWSGRGDYRSIGEGIEAAAGRDVVRIVVRSGTYRECLTLRRTIDLSCEGNAVVTAQGGSALVVTGGDSAIRGLTLEMVETAGDTPVVNISGGRTSFRDCRVGGRARTGVRISAARSHPSFSECVVAGDFEVGVAVRESADALLERCNIGGASLTGLHISDRAHPVIRATTIQGGQRRGVFVSQDGRGILDQCDISSNGDDGVELARGSDAVLLGCRIAANGGYGVRAGSGAMGTIKNCLLEGNRLGPMRLDPGHQVKRENVTTD